ncbi:MAG: tripartite tricarboxylate transporter TctB family protein [Thermodesulfobacteriota bacterium]
MKKLQIIAGVIIMAFALFICLGASKLSLGTLKQPGPSFLPLGYGILLFVLSAIFVIRAGMRKGAPGDSASALWQNLTWQRVPITLAALFVYALLLERLGYPLCTWILMVLFFWGKGIRRRSIAIVGGFVVSIASYILFSGLLNVRLPSGWFGI